MTIRRLRVRDGAALALLAAVGCAVEPGTESVGTIQQKIVGGAPATPGEYPWMVEIALKNTDGAFYHNCGGSLIAKRWVLTAGHCLRKDKDPAADLIPKGDLRITLGEHDLASTDGKEQVIAIANTYTHPLFAQPVDQNGLKQTGINDIGLIELAADAALNDRVQTVRLASGDDGVGKQVRLSGWGANSSPVLDGKPPETYLKDHHTVVVDPTAGCNQRLELNALGGRDIQATEICSYDFHNDAYQPGVDDPNVFDFQSACYGDSGSPLVTNRSATCVEQVGVHTWGDDFCISYDAATRVSSYLDWIRQYVPNLPGNRSYEAETMSHSTGGAHPGGWNIWDNGYAAFSHTFNGGQQQLIVRASGQNGNGWPNMQVSVNGAVVYNTTVASTAWTDYGFSFNAPVGSAQVRVSFTNDYYQPNANPPIDRNLFLDKVTVVENAPCGGGVSPFSAQLDVYDDWGTGYCARVRLINAGSAPTTSWNVVVSSGDSTVYQWWNSPAIPGTGNHTIVPVGWNAALNPGAFYNSTGFCANRAAGTTTKPVVVSATASY